jgi:hypothetical protein
MCINAVLLGLLAAFFLVYPPIRAALDLRDPALRQPGIPNVAWRLYRNLTPRYAAWAQQRVALGGAEKLSTSNISGTEWPLFGSVFYLWAIEDLQSAWEAGDHRTKWQPRVYAREAIITASELVIDSKHATWVRQHWGENYLHRENVFYRMLVISALTSREKLLQDHAHLDLLRDQVESFAKELDATSTGLLDDYPGQCFPGDVMAAIAAVRRADAVLGTDHSAFVSRALRAFTGTAAIRYPIPPFSATARTGLPESPIRGSGNSYVCLLAPELWPSEAKQWHSYYDRYFWQERATTVGYREFAKGLTKHDWDLEVDSGPVVAGYGVAANAFGVGAARRNGRFDRAYPLAAEMLATAWELPTGVLAVPRLLSNLSDAPLLGEAAILWLLTVEPEKGFPLKTGGSVPAYVYLVLLSAALLGAFLVFESTCRFRLARREPEPEVRSPGFQAFVWCCLLAAALAAQWTRFRLVGFALVLLALVLPTGKKRPRDDWELRAREAAARKAGGEGEINKP